MRRLKRLLLAASAATLLLAADASAVDPVRIDGNPLDVFVSDDGRLQARFDGETAGEFFSPGSDVASAGLNLVVDVGSDFPALKGFRGAFFTPVLQGSVTGSGTAESPYTLVTTYSADTVALDTVTVTQTVTYVNGQRRFRVRYDLSHSAGSNNTTVRPTLGADLYIGGSDFGVGFLSGSPGSRTVGGINQDSGASGGIREITPWSHHVVAFYSSVWNQISAMGNLSDTIESTFVDNGAAVQWPDTTIGYPFGDASFEAEWVFERFAALELTPASATRTTGGTHAVDVATQNSDGTPAAGRNIIFSITGANPGSGSVVTTSNGLAQISWDGTDLGTDTLTAFADLNNNAQRDGNEPQREVTVDWVKPIEAEVSAARLGTGRTHPASVRVLLPNGEADENRRVRYWVEGANAIGNSGAALDGGLTDATGRATFGVVGSQPGEDTVHAFTDLDDDGAKDSGEPEDVIALERVGLGLNPASATLIAPGTNTVNAAVERSTVSNPDTVRWIVSGVNPAAGSATPDGSGQASFGWNGNAAGRDNLLAYVDLDDDGQQDASEPTAQASADWVAAQAPAQSGPGPQPDPGPQPEPLTISLDPTSAERDAGQRHEVDAFVRRGAAPASGIPVRFNVAGPNPTAGSADADTDGHVLISWLGQSNGTDTLTAYGDENGDGIRQASEPQATATVTWRNGLPPSIRTASSIDQLPDPEPFRQTNIQPVGTGEVFVKLPGGAAGASQTVNKGFIPLRTAAQLPVGTIIDADQGRTKIESAAKARGPQTQTADFHSGTFRVTQPRAASPVTEMVMEGGSFRSCTRSKSRRSATKSQRRRTVRRLWGSGKGRFRTRGRYSSATVRGTEWVVEDRCDGTLTRVRSGTVTVRDFPRRRNVSVRAGRSYLALRTPPRSLSK